MQRIFSLTSLLVMSNFTSAYASFTNQVLSLNGSSAYVSIPSAASLQNSSEITIEAWIYPMPPQSDVNSVNGQFIVKGDDQIYYSARSYDFDWTTNSVNTRIGEGIEVNLFLNKTNWALLGASLPETNWVHVAATYSSVSGLFQLFTNGVLAASTTTDVNGVALAGQLVRQTTLPVNLGGQTIPEGPIFAAGYMDEVRIWSKARTQVEIAESRFCRLSGAEANLAGYWNFDDGGAVDLTGNGNNGTFNGGASVVANPGQDVVHQGICGAPYFDAASLAFWPGAGFHQTVVGPSGLNLQIDASTNLLNWLPLFVLPNFSGRLEFIDPAALNFSQRFYRAVPQ